MMDHDRKSIPGPENILRIMLNNGIRLLARENAYSRTVAVIGSIPCGSYLDPMDMTGLADFTAACLNTGTRSHDFDSVYELLEGSGASLGFACGPKAFTVHGTCLAEDLPMLLSLLKEILDEPSFPEDHMEIYRARVLSAYELHLHDPESMADERLDKLLFGSTPYGRPNISSREEVNSITREHLLDFHRRYIGPENMILTIAGGVPVQKIQDICENVLGSWHKEQEKIDPAAYFPAVPAPAAAVCEHIEIPEKSEMSLLLGTMGPSRHSADYLPVKIGNSILGEFGMMGRIGKAVRERNGLAYYAGSSITALSYGGCWTVEAGVNPSNVEKAADLIRKELVRFTSEKVCRNELEDVKSLFLGSIPLSLESNAGVASLLMSMENFDLGLDHLLNLPGRINSITEEIVLETARKWLDPEKLVQVTAGTAAK